MDLNDENNLPILMIDDEEDILFSMEALLYSAGYTQVHALTDPHRWKNSIEEVRPRLILLDLFMPGVSGAVILERIIRDFPTIPVIIVSGNQDVPSVVECMRKGAFTYVTKPIDQELFLAQVKKALEFGGLQEENSRLGEKVLGQTLQFPDAFEGIITKSPSMLKIFNYIEAISESSKPVLITGETGVGKELIAKAVHQVSRRSGPLVAINIGGMDSQQLSDSLFGHVKGAFTGADVSRSGLVASAASGTIFMDEIGEMAKEDQVKLLRLIQENQYMPLGADTPRDSSARVVAATNISLTDKIDQGSFRQDLYQRFMHNIPIPPLRDRLEDLEPLTCSFVEESAKELGRAVDGIDPRVFCVLRSYSFPGNIRELQSMVYDALTFHPGGALKAERFEAYIKKWGGEASIPSSEACRPGVLVAFPNENLPTLRQVADSLVDEALARAEGSQAVAAGLIGITPQALNQRLKKRKSD